MLGGYARTLCNIATYLRGGVLILHTIARCVHLELQLFFFLLLNLLFTLLYSCCHYTLFLMAPTVAVLQISLYAKL